MIVVNKQEEEEEKVKGVEKVEEEEEEEQQSSSLYNLTEDTIEKFIGRLETFKTDNNLDNTFYLQNNH
jgi:hypothetical protein